MRNIKNRSIAIFYTCGTSNLKCTYCGIDKNPILAKIDKALEESFKGDYYFNQVQKYFPYPDQLKRIETWGGEPFLGMDRIHHTLHKIIEHYPYFDQMYSSTNFSYPEWTDKVFNLLEQFGKYPERKFTYELQLSMDGPEYINDMGRGQGVTQRCLENFDKLVELIPNRLPPNVQLNILVKQTLNNDSIRLLCDKQKIIEYYQYFEDMIDKVERLGFANVKMECTIPNTATPSPVTVEEGKIFAEFVKLCRTIERENPLKHYFRYYNRITPFGGDPIMGNLSYNYCSTVCGSGSTMVGFLPNGLISTCHEGFTNLYEDYKKYAASSTREEDGGTINFANFVEDTSSTIYCVTEEGHEAHEDYMSNYNSMGTSARLGNIVGTILALAMAGQVDEKYLDEEEALKAALFLQERTAYCIKDNYNRTGSFTCVPVGIIKLLLNGAIEYLNGWIDTGDVMEGDCCDIRN